jgi:hypothetical protein
MRLMSELLEGGIVAPDGDKVADAYVMRLSRAREVVAGIGRMLGNVSDELQKSPEDLGTEFPLVGQMYLFASDAGDLIAGLVQDLDGLFRKYAVPQAKMAVLADRSNKLAYYGK